MRTFVSLSLLLALLQFACVENDVDITYTTDKPHSSRINLLELVPGQQTMYRNYQQRCDTSDFRWTGDTLVTTIFKDGDELFMSEQYTEGSPSYSFFGGRITYPVSSKAGVMMIPQRHESILFNFYGSDKIHLIPTERIELSQSGCLMATDSSIFIGDDIGHIEAFDFGDFRVEDKTAVSCVPIFDVDAYLVYDSYQLYLSHQVTKSTFGGTTTYHFVNGWMMIE